MAAVGSKTRSYSLTVARRAEARNLPSKHTIWVPYGAHLGIAGLSGAPETPLWGPHGAHMSYLGPIDPYGAHMIPIWAIWAICSPDGAHMGPMWEIPGSEGLI